MTHDAIIKFAPLTTLERLNDPGWQNRDRLVYDSGALKFLPTQTSVPLVIDHDTSRTIGVVNNLWRLDWLDGPWLAASATVTDPPAWLSRGTRASFECKAARKCSFGYDILRSGYVTEVSVLSPGVEPAEPLAEVLSYRPTEAPKPTPTPTAIRRTAAPDARRTKHSEIEELRRRMEWLGPNASMETVLENMKRELGYVRSW